MDDNRKKLIALLSKREGEYISGQDLSKKLNISRSAIWKHMNELKKDGYVIEGITNKGYRIISTPEHLSEHGIQWGLQTKWLGKSITYYEQVDSTQLIGHELARKNYPHGSVIIANEQTKGRGRMKRYWDSKRNRGLWFTIILRPDQLEPNKAPQLTLVTAVGLTNYLKKFGLDIQIKWPNDIFVKDKKLAGILTEMQAEQDTIEYVLLGIGLNVKHTVNDLHESVKDKATSLYLETNMNYNMNEICKSLFNYLEEIFELYMDEGFSVIKNMWESSAYKIGEWIHVKTNETWKAKIVGIHEDGALIVMDENNKQHVLYSAEILW